MNSCAIVKSWSRRGRTHTPGRSGSSEPQPSTPRLSAIPTRTVIPSSSGKKRRTNSSRSQMRARWGETSTRREKLQRGRAGPSSSASCSSGRTRLRGATRRAVARFEGATIALLSTTRGEWTTLEASAILRDP